MLRNINIINGVNPETPEPSNKTQSLEIMVTVKDQVGPHDISQDIGFVHSHSRGRYTMRHYSNDFRGN